MLAAYGDDLDIITLTTQLESLKVNFSSDEHSIKDIIETLKVNFSSDEHSIKDITETLKTFSVNSREYFSQVIILLKIFLVMPATNAVSERSVLNLRIIKDWLCTSMTQKRLNHCMTSSVHKDNLDQII